MATCVIATAPKITRCPPAPQRNGLTFDQHAGAARAMYPVSVRFAAGGEVESPGLSFTDYSRMGTQSRKSCGERRLPTPVWALDPAKVRALIVRTMEVRAGLHEPQRGTE